MLALFEKKKPNILNFYQTFYLYYACVSGKSLSGKEYVLVQMSMDITI